MRVLFRVVLGGGGRPARCCSTCPRSRCPTGSPGITPARAGDPGGAAGRALRRAAAGHDRDLRRRRQLAGQPQAAAALGARRRCYEIGTALVVAVDRAAAVRRQRPPGARRAEPARRATPAGSAGCAATWCRCSRTRSSARCALAAGMDTRGYGRAGRRHARRAPAHRRADAGRPVRHLRRHLRRASTTTAPAAAGPADARRSASPSPSVGLVGAGRRVQRTRYRPDPWRWPGVRGDGGRRRGRGRGVVGRPAPVLDRLPAARRRGRPCRGGRSGRRRGRRWSPRPCRRPSPARRWSHDRAPRHHRRLRRRRPSSTTSTSTVEEGELVLVSGPTGVGQVDPARRRHRPGAALHRRAPRGRRAARRRQHPATAAARARARRSATSARTRPPGSSPTPSRRSSPTAWSSSACRRTTMRRRVEETLDLLGIADLRAPRPAHPVGRRAAAGRHRLGADHAPAAAGARRADLRARPDRGRGRARDADPAGARPRASRCCSPSTGSSGWSRSSTGCACSTGDGGRVEVGEPGRPAGPLARRTARSSSSAGTPAGRRCR